MSVKGDSGKDEWLRAPKAQSSVASPVHRWHYIPTAGTLVIRDDDKPMANIGSVAYTKREAGEAGRSSLPATALAARDDRAACWRLRGADADPSAEECAIRPAVRRHRGCLHGGLPRLSSG